MDYDHSEREGGSDEEQIRRRQHSKRSKTGNGGADGDELTEQEDAEEEMAKLDEKIGFMGAGTMA